MKTKIIAVLVALIAGNCAVVMAQNGTNVSNSQRGNTNNNTTVNNTPVVTPAPSPQANTNGSLLSQQNLQLIYAQVAKSKEYQNLKKNITNRVNNSKVGKKVSNFRRFLQRIGLAKKPVANKTTK